MRITFSVASLLENKVSAFDSQQIGVVSAETLKPKNTTLGVCVFNHRSQDTNGIEKERVGLIITDRVSSGTELYGCVKTGPVHNSDYHVSVI